MANVNKKKILTITIGGLVVFLIIAGGTFLWLKKSEMSQTEGQVVTVPPRIYTQEEKRQILVDLAKSAPKDTTPVAVRLHVLQNLAKKSTKSPAVSTEEKLIILQSLAYIKK